MLEYRYIIFRREKVCVSTMALRTILQRTSQSVRFSCRGISTGLTSQQRQQFERDGFLIVPNFADKSSIAAIRAEAERIVENSDPENMSVFTTVEQVGHVFMFLHHNNLRSIESQMSTF